MSGYLQSAKYKALILTVKCTGLLSIIGSGLIVYDLLRSKRKEGIRCNRKKNLKSTPKRIMLLMSLSDAIYGFVAWILGTWMVPKETGAFLAAGNEATCQAQGFLQLWFYGTATCLNASLAITYVLNIYGWREDHFRKWLPQFFLLAFPLLFFFAVSTWGAAEHLYRFNFGPTCGVPANVTAYKILGMVWQIACFGVIFISVSILFWKVLNIERATDRYNFGGEVRRTQSIKVAKEGLLYAGSFFLTYFPFMVIYTMSLLGKRPDWWMIYVTFFCLPLQGFWNAIVYFRKNGQGGLVGRFSSSLNSVRKSGGHALKRLKSLASDTSGRTSMSSSMSRFSVFKSIASNDDSSCGENGIQEENQDDIENGKSSTAVNLGQVENDAASQSGLSSTFDDTGFDHDSEEDEVETPLDQDVASKAAQAGGSVPHEEGVCQDDLAQDIAIDIDQALDEGQGEAQNNINSVAFEPQVKEPSLAQNPTPEKPEQEADVFSVGCA